MELATADAAAEAVVLVVAAACNAIHDHMDLQAAKAGLWLDLSVRPSIDDNSKVTTGIGVHAPQPCSGPSSGSYRRSCRRSHGADGRRLGRRGSGRVASSGRRSGGGGTACSSDTAQPNNSSAQLSRTTNERGHSESCSEMTRIDMPIHAQQGSCAPALSVAAAAASAAPAVLLRMRAFAVAEAALPAAAADAAAVPCRAQSRVECSMSKRSISPAPIRPDPNTDA